MQHGCYQRSRPTRTLRVSSLIALLPFLALSTATADTKTVYKYTNDEGVVVFSDSPVPGAQTMEINLPASLGTVGPKAPSTNATPDAKKAPVYHRIGITTPSQDATYSNDVETIVISGFSEPALRPGNLYRFIVNGEASAPQPISHYTLLNSDRGEYTVSIEIVDRNLQTLIRSEPVRFFVKRHSVLLQNQHKPAPARR